MFLKQKGIQTFLEKRGMFHILKQLVALSTIGEPQRRIVSTEIVRGKPNRCSCEKCNMGMGHKFT